MSRNACCGTLDWRCFVANFPCFPDRAGISRGLPGAEFRLFVFRGKKSGKSCQLSGFGDILKPSNRSENIGAPAYQLQPKHGMIAGILCMVVAKGSAVVDLLATAASTRCRQ